MLMDTNVQLRFQFNVIIELFYYCFYECNSIQSKMASPKSVTINMPTHLKSML